MSSPNSILVIILAISFLTPRPSGASDAPIVKHVRDVDIGSRLTDSRPTAVIWSHDGTRLLTVSDFGSRIDTWDRDGTNIFHLNRATGRPYINPSVAFWNSSLSVVIPASHIQPDFDGTVPLTKSALSIYDTVSGTFQATISGPPVNESRPSDTLPDIYMTDEAQSILALKVTNSDDVDILSSHDLTHPKAYKPQQGYHTRSFAVSPDGKMLALGESHGDVLIFALGAEGAETQMSNAGLQRSAPYFICFSQGQVAVGTHVDHRLAVRLFDAVTGALVTEESQFGAARLRSMACQPNGPIISLVDVSGQVWLWNTKAGGINSLTIDHAGSAAFSPDGSQLAITAPHELKIYEVH